MALSVKELMIGDWVCCKGVNRRVACIGTFQGFLIKFTDGFLMMNHTKYEALLNEKINPIPLTEEILKKNGWASVPEYGIPFEDGQQDIIYYYWSPNFNAYPLNLLQLADNSDMFKVFNGVTIRYVHELQHALRLCGLNELADSLKIQ